MPATAAARAKSRRRPSRSLPLDCPIFASGPLVRGGHNSAQIAANEAARQEVVNDWFRECFRDSVASEYSRPCTLAISMKIARLDAAAKRLNAHSRQVPQSRQKCMIERIERFKKGLYMKGIIGFCTISALLLGAGSASAAKLSGAYAFASTEMCEAQLSVAPKTAREK